MIKSRRGTAATSPRRCRAAVPTAARAGARAASGTDRTHPAPAHTLTAHARPRCRSQRRRRRAAPSACRSGRTAHRTDRQLRSSGDRTMASCGIRRRRGRARRSGRPMSTRACACEAPSADHNSMIERRRRRGRRRRQVRSYCLRDHLRFFLRSHTQKPQIVHSVISRSPPTAPPMMGPYFCQSKFLACALHSYTQSSRSSTREHQRHTITRPPGLAATPRPPHRHCRATTAAEEEEGTRFRW